MSFLLTARLGKLGITFLQNWDLGPQNGHYAPPKLGIMSHKNWALRSPKTGYYAPTKLGIRSPKWALYPSKTGDYVPQKLGITFLQNITIYEMTRGNIPANFSVHPQYYANII
jgi:hypothetical protein